MNPATTKFILFGILGVGALLLGYVGRKRGWLPEEISRPIHFHTVTWVWSAAFLITLWRLPIEPTAAWVFGIEAVCVAVPALLMIPVARAIGCRPNQIGVLAVGAGIGNIGFTLGGYLCYLMIPSSPERPGEVLGYVGVATSTLMVGVITVCYPIARHFGDLPSGGSLAGLMLKSLTTLPALPLYAGITGVVLGATGVPFPAAIDRYYVFDAVVMVMTVSSYLGIGLRLRFGGSVPLRRHAALAGFTFLVTPILTLLIIGLSRATPDPMAPVAARVMLVESVMPTGVSVVMLANVFHLDVRMAGTVWLWNTVGFLAVVLPVLLVVL